MPSFFTPELLLYAAVCVACFRRPRTNTNQRKPCDFPDGCDYVFCRSYTLGPSATCAYSLEAVERATSATAEKKACRRITLRWETTCSYGTVDGFVWLYSHIPSYNVNPGLVNPRLLIWEGTISVANDYCLGEPPQLINQGLLIRG